jgi:hypothetical protein
MRKGFQKVLSQGLRRGISFFGASALFREQAQEIWAAFQLLSNPSLHKRIPLGKKKETWVGIG